MKSNGKRRQFLQDQLKKEQMHQIMMETRRNGGQGWILRDQLHADEIVREDRIKSLFPADPHLLVALQPDTGAFGVFSVAKEEAELDFENGGFEPASPLHSAKESAALHAKNAQVAFATAEKALQGINNGHIKNYEDLAAVIPSGVSTEAVLALLSQTHKPGIDLETLKGQITLGGAHLTRKLLSRRSTVQALVDVRAIDEDGPPNGTVFFKFESIKPTDTELPDFFRSKRRVCAALQTDSDSKALALLHFAKVPGALVYLELQMAYQIAERSWDIKVVAIMEEEELLAKDRPAQTIFNDW